MSKFFTLTLLFFLWLVSAQDGYQDQPIAVEYFVGQVNSVLAKSGRVHRIKSSEVKKRVRRGVIHSLYGNFGFKCTEREVSVSLVLSKSAANAVPGEYKEKIPNGFASLTAMEAYEALEKDVYLRATFIGVVTRAALRACNSDERHFAMSFWASGSDRRSLILSPPASKEEYEKYKQ